MAHDESHNFEQFYACPVCAIEERHQGRRLNQLEKVAANMAARLMLSATALRMRGEDEAADILERDFINPWEDMTLATSTDRAREDS